MKNKMINQFVSGVVISFIGISSVVGDLYYDQTSPPSPYERCVEGCRVAVSIFDKK